MKYFILTLISCLGITYLSAQNASKNIHQIINIEQEELPSSVHIHIQSGNVEVKKAAGSRIWVCGSAKISIPNLYFLDHLIKNGRYELELTGDNRAIRIEDKQKGSIMVKGQDCKEEIKYTIYVPEDISTVIVWDNETGDNIVMSD
ncbi:MAG: hypothetical protein GY810_03685 [Aureispira sp.]|nr:hypothetical protein [Aureispira sp.]